MDNEKLQLIRENDQRPHDLSGYAFISRGDLDQFKGLKLKEGLRLHFSIGFKQTLSGEMLEKLGQYIVWTRGGMINTGNSKCCGREFELMTLDQFMAAITEG